MSMDTQPPPAEAPLSERCSKDELRRLSAYIKFFFGASELQEAAARFDDQIPRHISNRLAPDEYCHELIRYLDRRGTAVAFRNTVVTPKARKDEALRLEGVAKGDLPGAPDAKEILLEECPYPGFQAFTNDDAGLFFGRDSDTKELLALVRDPRCRWVRVEGSSGVGKSSLVNAGVLPALRTAGSWAVAQMLPGKSPMERLADALCTLPSMPDHRGALVERLEQPKDGLRGILREYALKRPGVEVLLVVDQLDELWTLAAPDEAERFEEALLALLEDVEIVFTLLTTIRSDRLERLLNRARGLGVLLNRDYMRPYAVKPMTRDALDLAIHEPAGKRGVAVQADLGTRLWAQIAQDDELKGGLPVVAFALRELWARCEHSFMLRFAKSAAASEPTTELETPLDIKGMIADAADALLQTFEDVERSRIRDLLLALSNVDLDDAMLRTTARPITRHRAVELLGGGQAGEGLLDRLTGSQPEPPRARPALVKSGQSRPLRALVRTSREDDKDARVDVIHDTLLDRWQQYQQWRDAWIKANADGLRAMHELVVTARQWAASGRPADGLPRGTIYQRLVGAKLDEDRVRAADRALAREYLEALVAHENRLQLERQHAERQRGGQRWRTLGLSLAIVAACGAIGGVAWLILRGIDSRSAEAIDETRVAIAADALGRDDVTLALGMLREAETADAHLYLGGWTRHATQSLAVPWREQLRLRGHAANVTAVSYNAAGDRLVSTSEDGEIRLWDLATASSTTIGAGVSAEFVLRDPSVRDREAVAILTTDGVKLWTSDAALDSGPPALPLGEAVRSLMVSEASNRFLTATITGNVHLWDGADGSLLWELPAENAGLMAVSPLGSWVATTSQDGRILNIWSVNDRDFRASIYHSTQLRSLVFDGEKQIATATPSGARTYPVGKRGRSKARAGQGGILSTVGFDSTNRLITGADDGVVTRWPLDPSEPATTFTDPSGGIAEMTLSPSAPEAVITSMTGIARVWDLETSTRLVTLGNEPLGAPASYRGDGRGIATAAKDTVHVWAANETEAPLKLQGNPSLSGVGFSRGGKCNEDQIIAHSSGGVAAWSRTGESQIAMCAAYRPGRTPVYCNERALVVTEGEEGTIHVWDAITGAELHEWKLAAPQQCGTAGGCHMNADPKPVAVCSPDGSRMFVAAGRLASIFDPTTGARIVEQNHLSEVIGAAFSPDSTQVVSATRHSASVWDASTGVVSSRIVLHEPASAAVCSAMSTLVAVADTSQGPRVVERTQDDTFRLWDPVQEVSLAELKDDSKGPRPPNPGACALNAESEAERVAYSPDGRRVVTLLRDGSLGLWNVQTGKLLRQWGSEIAGVRFSPDGGAILARTTRYTALSWDASSGRQRGQEVSTRSDSIIVPNAVGDQFMTLGGTTVEVFDLMTGARRVGNALDDGRVLAVSTLHIDVPAACPPLLTACPDLPDEHVILRAAVARRDVVHIVDAHTGRRIAELAEPELSPRTAEFSRTGTRVATLSSFGKGVIWSAETGDLVARLSGHSGELTALTYSGNSTEIVTVSSDGTANRWTSDGELTHTINLASGSLRDVVHSPRGERVVVVSDEKVATIWDSDTGISHRLPAPAVESVTFDDLGKFIVTGHQDGRARIWNADDGQPGPVLAGHSGPIISVAFRARGTLIATASADRTVRVWGRERGTLMEIHEDFDQPVVSVAFNPAGNRLVAASRDGVIYVWPVWRDEATLLHRLWTATPVCPSLAVRVDRLAQSTAAATHDLKRCEQMVQCLHAEPNDEATFVRCLADYRASSARAD